MSDIDNRDDVIDTEVDETEEVDNDQDIENQNEDDAGAGDGEGESSDEGQDGQPKMTDKGTKLDPNPMSALNQQLANANREMGRYQQLLEDPVALEAYLGELKNERGGKREEEVDLNSLDPKKLETVEDVQEFAAKLQKGFQQRLSKIEGQIGKGNQVQQIKDLSNRIASEISEVVTQVPELRPTNADGSKNPSYDPKLDKFIGDLYESIDLDQKTGFYKGSISFKGLTSAVMAAVRYGESRGSKKAQTVVVDKTNGRIIDKGGGNSGGNQGDESKLSGAGLIGARIAKAYAKKSR